MMKLSSHIIILLMFFLFVSCSKSDKENNSKRLKSGDKWKIVLGQGGALLGHDTITIENNCNAHYKTLIFANGKPTEYKDFDFTVSEKEAKKVLDRVNLLRFLKGDYYRYFKVYDGTTWFLHVYEDDKLIRAHFFNNRFPLRIKWFAKHLNSIASKYCEDAQINN